MKRENLYRTARLQGLSKDQTLQLELIERVDFGVWQIFITGEKIVIDLIDHPEIWKACLMDRFEDLPLLKLRDLPKKWNVNTLYIIPKEGAEKDLEKLVKAWNPNKIDWIGKKEAWSLMRKRCCILRVHWGPSKPKSTKSIRGKSISKNIHIASKRTESSTSDSNFETECPEGDSLCMASKR